FSHGAEELLPEGYHHEQLSVDVILSPEMQEIWLQIPLIAKDVAKVAVGVKKWPGSESDFSPWDELMTEIVTGDAFGVDRIDYLLRDSLHAGVAYGRFDHYRLIDTLRVLPSADPDKPGKPVIGIERGGLHAAEGLQLGRYFMFEQLYFHKVRRALDIHLKAFLRAFLPAGTYPIDVDAHLRLTDNEVLAAMRKAAEDPAAPGHEPARRIMKDRAFYRVLYVPSADDLTKAADPIGAVHRAARDRFPGCVEKDVHTPVARPMEFAVDKDGAIVSSVAESQILGQIPTARFGYVFITPEKLDEGRRWLRQNIRGILETP
ncbi:MAG TPA: hypothetical protein VK648_00990, partial [Gemmatimonadaceae bacterium]|nr:hypothetical protein [Gemmatimonadaceae bacterium]